VFVYSSLDSLWLLLLCGNDVLVSALFCVCTFLAFMVMMLMFMGHLWRPMAHTGAAVAGSLGLPTCLHRRHSDTYICAVSAVGRGMFMNACCFRRSSDSEISHVTTTQNV